MRKVNFKLDTGGMKKAIDHLEKYKKTLKHKSYLLIRELTDFGVDIARVGFKVAMYDGVNDVEVTKEVDTNGPSVIIARGNALLFIEFGTGVYYSEPIHPKANEMGMKRGEYGKGYGKQETWYYQGDTGTHGLDIGGGKVLTRGNKANMVMYNVSKELREKLIKSVKGAFDD